MKSLILPLYPLLTLSAVLNAAAPSTPPARDEDPMIFLQGSEVDQRLAWEQAFLRQQYAEISYDHSIALSRLNHVWSPRHDKIVFWGHQLPCGSVYLLFWIFERDKEGNYHMIKKDSYSSRLYMGDYVENIHFGEKGITVSSVVHPTYGGTEQFYISYDDTTPSIPQPKQKGVAPFEAEFPYKYTDNIKVTNSKREWVRRVGDRVGGTLKWTDDGKFAILYNEIGGGLFYHYFVCFKDDGTGWMRTVGEFAIQGYYQVKDFSIKGDLVTVDFDGGSRKLHIEPYTSLYWHTGQLIRMDDDDPNKREVSKLECAKRPAYIHFGNKPGADIPRGAKDAPY